MVSYHNVRKRLIGHSKYECTSVACTLYRVQSCEAVIRDVIKNFLIRADACEYSVIRAICNGDRYYQSIMKKSLLSRLYRSNKWL